MSEGDGDDKGVRERKRLTDVVYTVCVLERKREKKSERGNRGEIRHGQQNEGHKK